MCINRKRWILRLLEEHARVELDVPVSKDNWLVILDSKAAMNALQLVRDMAVDGSTAYKSGRDKFLNRKTAMLIDRPKNAMGLTNMYERIKPAQIGMVPLPKGPDFNNYYAPKTVDDSFSSLGSNNPLSAVAYMYELRKLAIENRESTDKAAVTERRRIMSDEHTKIIMNISKKLLLSHQT